MTFYWTDTFATSLVTNIAVSPDGNRLAGLSGSRLFLADRAAGTNWTIAPTGSTGWLPHATLQFSASGQFLVYVTAASLVAGDTNGTTDVYLYDFVSGSNRLLSQSCHWPGAANGASDSATISADGRFVAYRSFASDVFAWKIAASSSVPGFGCELVLLPARGGLPTLVWPAQPGASYRVQYKDNLDDAAWQDLLGTISFVGGSGYATDLFPSSGMRFYRIVAGS